MEELFICGSLEPSLSMSFCTDCTRIGEKGFVTYIYALPDVNIDGYSKYQRRMNRTFSVSQDKSS